MKRLKKLCLNNGIRRQIVGNGNSVQMQDSTYESVLIDIRGNDNTVLIRSNCRLAGLTIQIRGDSHRVEIGKNCRFNGDSILWFEDEQCRLSIGDGATFESVHIAVVESGSAVDIGADCMFANDIDVRTSDSHSIVDAKTGLRINPPKSVTIHDHVWVGAHCRLLKGTMVARNSIVGTGAVLTKAFEEPNVTIAGVPARVVSRGVDWCRERIACSE